MKKDPPRSESDPLKIHISEIITALVPQSNSPTSKLKDGYRIHVVVLFVSSESPGARVSSTESTLQLQP